MLIEKVRHALKKAVCSHCRNEQSISPWEAADAAEALAAFETAPNPQTVQLAVFNKKTGKRLRSLQRAKKSAKIYKRDPEEFRQKYRVIAHVPEPDMSISRALARELVALLEGRYSNGAPLLSPSCTGYRRRLRSHQAFDILSAAIKAGSLYVVRTDFAAFFDNMAQDILELKLTALLQQLGLHDRQYVDWVMQLVYAPRIVEWNVRDRDGVRPFGFDMEFKEGIGIPQGNPLSPFLSNVYLNNLDHELSRYCYENKMFNARYGDDMAIACPSLDAAKELLEQLDFAARTLKLTLNQKTEIIDLHKEPLDFLGMQFNVDGSRQIKEDRIHRKRSAIQNRTTPTQRQMRLNKGMSHLDLTCEIFHDMNSNINPWINGQRTRHSFIGHYQYGHPHRIREQLEALDAFMRYRIASYVCGHDVDADSCLSSLFKDRLPRINGLLKHSGQQPLRLLSYVKAFDSDGHIPGNFYGVAA